ncbi:MAG: hypothetical protein JWO38_4224 [Gemmataceae bacterium]|nr:hypothetical protein [Gemmataceae bacterium]
MSPADAHRLQDVFRRESRSLLQYVRGAAPYASGTDRKLLDAVQRVATEETAAIETLGEFLGARRVPLPYLGSFPVAFTDLNFVGIRYLIPKIIAEQKQDLAALEVDVGVLTDPDAGSAVRQLVDAHQRHLAELEQLGS